MFGSDEEQKRPVHSLMADIVANGSFFAELQSAAEQTRGNLVIDEWSCALTGSALAGATDANAERVKFCSTQADLYANSTAGWSFWSESASVHASSIGYKTENCAEDDNWCFKRAVSRFLPASFAPVHPSPSTHAICRLIGKLNLRTWLMV